MSLVIVVYRSARQWKVVDTVVRGGEHMHLASCSVGNIFSGCATVEPLNFGGQKSVHRQGHTADIAKLRPRLKKKHMLKVTFSLLY